MVLALLMVGRGWALTLDAAPAAEAVLRRGAVVLDTRSTVSFLLGHIPTAVAVDWRIGVVGGVRSGLLGPPEEVATAFAAVGVRADRPVLVVGDWADGWGEEGRVAWDLEYLGHPDVHVLRGGMSAWRGATAQGPSTPVPATFTATVRGSLRADRDAVKRATTVIDVREADEFGGSNAWLAAYGGHIPGAVNRPWRGLLESLPPPASGAAPVLYCTGGVRSAFAWMLLTAAGRPAVNYDGRWWDWAGHEPRPE